MACGNLILPTIRAIGDNILRNTLCLFSGDILFFSIFFWLGAKNAVRMVRPHHLLWNKVLSTVTHRATFVFPLHKTSAAQITLVIADITMKVPRRGKVIIGYQIPLVKSEVTLNTSVWVFLVVTYALNEFRLASADWFVNGAEARFELGAR